METILIFPIIFVGTVDGEFKVYDANNQYLGVLLDKLQYETIYIPSLNVFAVISPIQDENNADIYTNLGITYEKMVGSVLLFK